MLFCYDTRSHVQICFERLEAPFKVRQSYQRPINSIQNTNQCLNLDSGLQSRNKSKKLISLVAQVQQRCLLDIFLLYKSLDAN